MTLFVHLPYWEVTKLLLDLRKSEAFLRVGRILVLSLLAIAALGCIGPWGSAPEPDSLLCTVAKYPCYQGPAFGLPGFVSELGASVALLLLPLLDLASSLLVLLKLPRTYLLVLVLSCASFAILIFGMATSSPAGFVNGVGLEFVFYSTSALCLFVIPLAIAEHMRLHPGSDFFAGVVGIGSLPPDHRVHG